MKMKKLIVAGALALACLLPTVGRAQIFYTASNVVTYAAAPVQVGFQPVTQTAYNSLIGRTLQVGNINTNQTIVVGYGYTWTGWGGSNLLVAVTITNTFPASAGWTNGATWTTNIPAQTLAPSLAPWAFINLGNFTNPVSLQ